MIDEQIKVWITKASMHGNTEPWTLDMADARRFAELVAAHEREECATACEYRMLVTDGRASEVEGAANTLCAATIRARGRMAVVREIINEHRDVLEALRGR
jgi:hypothetical protein